MSDTTGSTATPPASAPTAAPAAAPSPASNAAPTSPEGSGAPPAAPDIPDFSGLDGDFDGGSEVMTPVVPDATAPTPVPVAPTPAPATPPAAPQPAPAQPPQAPAQPQPSPQGQPSSAPAPADPQGLAQQLDQHQGAILDALAVDRFRLSKEETDAIELDAAGAIPRLMAKTYYQAVQSSLLHIQNFVPQMVMNVTRLMMEQAKVEDGFYKANPALKPDLHGQDVYQFGNIIRASSPQLSQADFLRMVAAAVMAKHGLQPMAPPTAAQPQPAAPAFVPARQGVGVRTAPVAENPWEGLGRDYDS